MKEAQKWSSARRAEEMHLKTKFSVFNERLFMFQETFLLPLSLPVVLLFENCHVV